MPVIKLEPDEEETLNRHDFWRGCYATMLAELKTEEIKEYFAALPMMKGGRPVEGVEFFNLLWNEKGLVPMDWNYNAIHPLESFLIGKGYDAIGFFRRMLHRNNRATYMPGKVLLSWFYPVMDKFFDKYDPRELVLHMITVYTENYVQGTLHKRIKKYTDGEWTYSYMLFIGRKSFKKFYVFNFDYIVGEQIRAFPKMLDLPEFEELSYLNDVQRIEDILWAGEFRRADDGLYWNGKRIAVPDDYHAFMERGGFDIEKYQVPQRRVLVATEDIYCEARKRRVINVQPPGVRGDLLPGGRQVSGIRLAEPEVSCDPTGVERRFQNYFRTEKRQFRNQALPSRQARGEMPQFRVEKKERGRFAVQSEF